MEVSRRAAETSPLQQMAAGAAKLIEAWRSEVKEQWQPAELRIEEPQLVAVLEGWGQLGLDPVQLLWAILGAEWLMRARLVSHADFEEVLEDIHKAHLRGSGDPDETALVIECARPELWRRLRRRRFLVSYRRLAVPWAWNLAHSPREAHEVASGGRARIPDLIRVRQGPVPNLGPILAGVLVHGVAEHLSGLQEESEDLGLAVTRMLLKRKVLSHEFRTWRTRLDSPISDPAPRLSEPERRTTLRGYLVFHFLRVYSSMRDTYGWTKLREEGLSNPFFALGPAGDLWIARALYAVKWSNSSRAARGARGNISGS